MPRRSRRKSHCELILEILQDGRPHTHQELYAIGCVLHSRISDLRKRGYTITQHKEGDHYVYRLTGAPVTLSQPEEARSPLPASSGSESANAPDPQPTEGPASAPASGPPARGGSSEIQEEPVAAGPSWFADRAPAFTTPEAAGSTPAPRSPQPRPVAEVISLLEWRGFLEATDERIAELEPDPDQGNLFDQYEEVA